MTLQDFFVSGLPTPDIQTTELVESTKSRRKSEASKAPIPAKRIRFHLKILFKIEFIIILAATPPATPVDDVETRVKVAIQNPAIILLEDQHNANSNCLVLDVNSFLFLFWFRYKRFLLVALGITYGNRSKRHSTIGFTR